MVREEGERPHDVQLSPKNRNCDTNFAAFNSGHVIHDLNFMYDRPMTTIGKRPRTSSAPSPRPLSDRASGAEIVVSALETQPPGTPPLLKIDRQATEGRVSLAVGGEVDLNTAPALERALEDAERLLPRRIVLDLSKLEFIDSSGLHVLCQAQRRAEGSGHTLVLANVPAYTQRLFGLTGINALLLVTSSPSTRNGERRSPA